MTHVVGIDSSLTAAAIAAIAHPSVAPQPNAPRTAVVGEAGHRGDPVTRTAIRIGRQYRRILDAIVDMAPSVALVVIEELPKGMPPDATHMFLERAALHYRLIEGLAVRRIPVAEVPPAVLKLWATGAGNADKATVHAAMGELWPHARLDVRGKPNDNLSDALAAASIGAERLGWYEPEATYRHAPKVKWPEGITP